jgi:hypothetical protein
MTNGPAKSDSPVVPEKSSNNAGQSVAEGRGLAKGNLPQQNASRTPSRNDAPSALELRQTIRKRLQTKLNEVKAELQRRMHEPIPKQGKWLQAVVRGHIRYYGVPMNQNALWLFRFQVGRLWYRALSRRSQNGRVLWDRMRRLINRWLPLPTVCHPYPLRRMGVLT